MDEITIKIILTALGASGLWKLIGYLFKRRIDNRVKEAEANNHQAQANTQLLSNWNSWCQNLEKQVCQLQGIIKTQNNQIDQLNNQIKQLKSLVEELKDRNHELEMELEKLTNSHA